MLTLVASVQLVCAAGIIFGAVVLSWRAGDRFWSRQGR